MLVKSNIAIFASGSGTNAERIMSHFSTHKHIKVALVLSNKSEAFVLERAKNFGVKTLVINRGEFYDSENTLEILKDYEINFIILAGFLWLVPHYLIKAYPGRIVNIHPALLPAYGGKGMYGKYVHEAVIANGEKESGISIHLVDEEYDRGSLIFQARCKVLPDDTAESLAERIHILEHKHYPEVVENLIESLKT